MVSRRPRTGLNALSGIGGVQTLPLRIRRPSRGGRGLNALSGIGGVQTKAERERWYAETVRLNALSGIGGVQTYAEEEEARQTVLTS